MSAPVTLVKMEEPAPMVTVPTNSPVPVLLGGRAQDAKPVSFLQFHEILRYLQK